MKKVLVVGSLNMDIDIYLQRRPQAGETVLAKTMRLVPGGKGANQAYALGKMKVQTSMIGAVGQDSMGRDLLASLQSVGVDTSGVRILETEETGKAFIEIEDSGQNSISVISGANFALTEAMLDEHEALFQAADAVVMQLEVPLNVVVHAAKLAKKYNKLVVIDPAPAHADFPQELFPYIDITKPNETELGVLSGLPTTTKKEILTAANSLIKKGVKTVLVTLGGDGTLLVNKDYTQKFSAYPVQAVDTTAAGDCFLAAFLSQFDGQNYTQAIDFGAKAAAIAVTRPGAQSSIPDYEEVK